MLPDFIIIGAPRSGTTSLYQAMCNHPDITPSFRKEVHYFDGRTDRGLGWYRSNFPLALGRGRLTGEATPNYFAHPDAPSGVAAVVPHARLIALLRDPIERAHSAWRLKVYQGSEDRSFSEAIRHEAENPTASQKPTDRAAVGKGGRNGFAYLEKSRYAEHVERWLTAFPTDQLLVMRSEDLFIDPDRHLSRIVEFVGADPTTAPRLTHQHAAPPSDIGAGDREWLETYFAPYNRKLADLTGVTFE